MQITQRPYANNLNNQPNFGAKVTLNGISDQKLSEKFLANVDMLKHCGDDTVEHVINHHPGREYTLETKLKLPFIDKPLSTSEAKCNHPDDLIPKACHNLSLLFAKKLTKKSII